MFVYFKIRLMEALLNTFNYIILNFPECFPKFTKLFVNFGKHDLFLLSDFSAILDFSTIPYLEK